MERSAVVLAVIFARDPAITLGQETHPETHLFLVDISESMWAKPNGPQVRATELAVRQDKLKAWLKSHPNSRVTLMSFNTDIRSPIAYDLRKSGDRVNADTWVDDLAIKKPRGTHLWSCVGKALKRASDLSQQHPGESVTLHVLTDRVNTQRTSTREGVMSDFPEAKWQINESAGSGDFDITVQSRSIVASPTPDRTFPPPSPTATASAAPTAPASPSPTQPPSPTTPPRPEPSPSSSRPPTPTATVSISPTATPILNPCASRSPADAKVGLVIQEPRVVNSGQFVQFINQTLPCADSYLWTASRSISGATTGSSTQETAKPEREGREEHWGYTFTNPSPEPRSYTVRLTATYGDTRIAAAPITVLVKGPPSIWDILRGIIGSLGILVTGPTSILTLFKGFKELIASKKEGDAERAARERRRARRFFWIAALFFVAFVLFVLLILTKSSGTSAEQSIPSGPPVSVTADPTAASPKASAQSTTLTEGDAATALVSQPFVITMLAIALFIGAIVAAGWRGTGNVSRDLLGWFGARGTMLSRRSLIDQLDELERLRTAQVIPRTEVGAFKNALFERLKKEYEMDNVPQIRPILSNDLKKLINSLIFTTKKGLIRWTDKSKDSGKTSVVDQPTGDANEPQPLRFRMESIPSKTENEAKPQTGIEIYSGETGFGIDILNHDGDVIETIDHATFIMPAKSSARLGKLYWLAKDSALEIGQNLKEVLTSLEEKTKPSQTTPPP